MHYLTLPDLERREFWGRGEVGLCDFERVYHPTPPREFEWICYGNFHRSKSLVRHNKNFIIENMLQIPLKTVRITPYSLVEISGNFDLKGT